MATLATHAVIATPETATTIVVAAEDRHVRMRMVSALSLATQRVRGSASAREALDAGAELDLLVIHCDKVESAELKLLGELKREHPEVRIVVVCQATSGRAAWRAFDSGIEGFVFADELEAALAATVAAALAGQTSVPSRLRTSFRKPSLSFREKQILGMVVMGLTNSQIGSRLFLAESTVKSHLSSAFTKLDVRSRSEAAALILDPQGSLGMGILSLAQSPDEATASVPGAAAS